MRIADQPTLSPFHEIDNRIQGVSPQETASYA